MIRSHAVFIYNKALLFMCRYPTFVHKKEKNTHTHITEIYHTNKEKWIKRNHIENSLFVYIKKYSYWSNARAHTYSVRPIIRLKSNTNKRNKKKQAWTKFCMGKLIQKVHKKQAWSQIRVGKLVQKPHTFSHYMLQTYRLTDHYQL